MTEEIVMENTRELGLCYFCKEYVRADERILLLCPSCMTTYLNNLEAEFPPLSFVFILSKLADLHNDLRACSSRGSNPV